MHNPFESTEKNSATAGQDHSLSHGIAHIFEDMSHLNLFHGQSGKDSTAKEILPHFEISGLTTDVSSSRDQALSQPKYESLSMSPENSSTKPSSAADLARAWEPLVPAPYLSSNSQIDTSAFESTKQANMASDMNAWQARQDSLNQAKHDFLKMEKSY